MTAAVLRLKVTLDDVEPKVLRRIEVPADIKLDRLHLTLQAALGWTNSHLFEIRARDVGWGVPSPDWPDGPLDARKAKLIDVLEDAGTKTLRYLYDYGDGWEHTINVERMTPPEPGRRLSAPDRSVRTLSARGCRRPLGLRRDARSARRPRPRAPRRNPRMGRRRLRPARLRRRTAESRRRRARQTLVAKARRQEAATRLIRVLHRRVTREWRFRRYPPVCCLTGETSCKDEARIGQKNGLVRQWARRGTRPRQPADQRYESAYLFGAICPARGVGAALALPFADTEAMQLHLEEISAHVAEGAPPSCCSTAPDGTPPASSTCPTTSPRSSCLRARRN